MTRATEPTYPSREWDAEPTAGVAGKFRALLPSFPPSTPEQLAAARAYCLRNAAADVLAALGLEEVASCHD